MGTHSEVQIILLFLLPLASKRTAALEQLPGLWGRKLGTSERTRAEVPDGLSRNYKLDVPESSEEMASSDDFCLEEKTSSD